MFAEILATFKPLLLELIGLVLTIVFGYAAVKLRELAARYGLENAVKRAVSAAEAALSDETEGEPVDEGTAISIAHDYLRTSVPGIAKQLGADLGAIAAAEVTGLIARKVSK
jgi:hypothetical protein